MSRSCAYCGSSEEITGEHVFSECLLERAPTVDSAQIAPAPDRFVGADLKINDVCRKCNNERLEETDSYICELHDIYFKEYIEEGEAVDFHYDFEILLRWLLKTSYNSARAYGNDEHADRIGRHRDFMIGKDRLPNNIYVFVLPVVPYRMEKGDPSVEDLPPENLGDQDGETYLQPEIMGSKSITFDNNYLDKVLAYLIIINSYYFVVSLLSSGRFAKEREVKFLMDTNLQILPRHQTQTNLSPSGVDFIEASDLFNL